VLFLTILVMLYVDQTCYLSDFRCYWKWKGWHWFVGI